MSETAILKKRKILLVEDQVELLDLFTTYFKSEGFATATATNGVEALKKARTVHPDLILLDVVLPELDGFAVCEILRKDSATANTPIIMVTGLAGQIPRCAGIESGATDYVSKPISPSELVLKVRQTLSQTATGAA
jgi:DNA-binding response OmpR family regulator